MSFPRYESYKDSGVEWLGEIPAHWGARAIKHIVSMPITDGPHETPNFPDEGIPFVSAEAVATGVIDFSKIRGFISEADHIRYSQKYHPQIGDIYMVKSGATTGVTAIVETDIDFNIWSPLAAIRCGESVTPRFILNFMRSKNFQEAVTLNWSFGTQQNIGMGVIENLAITLPPIWEQLTIASFLDRETAKIDALIAEQQRLIELLKEKRQAVICHAVTKGLNPDAPMKDSGIEWLGEIPAHWEISRLGYESWVRARLGWKGLKAEEYVDDGFVFLATPNIKGLDIDFENVNFIDEFRYEESPEIKLREGDVLLAKDGSTLGTVNIIRVLPKPATVNSSIAVITPYKKLLGIFLYYVFLTSYIKNTIQRIKGGMGVPHLFQADLNKFYIPLPSIEDQQTIADFLDCETTKLDTLTAEAQRGIELLKERRAALISAAVTGKIDVRGLVAAQPQSEAAA